MADYQAARIVCDAETWRAFRAAALARGTSLARLLGQLVEREVRRPRRAGQRRWQTASDVASSLRVRAEVAERAYGRSGG